MKIILATAYDINPYKGSESATGWNFILQIARYNKVIAVTRKNNRANIENYIKNHKINISNIEFFYFDLPYYLRFWKKGARGSSLYFYLWQMFMPLFIINKSLKFDIAHNVNFHSDAFPTFLWVFKKPVVWGPINHHEKIPKKYLFPKSYYLKDRLIWLMKLALWKFDPFLKLAIYKSDIILGGNQSVKKRLGIKSENFILLSQVASKNNSGQKQKKNNIFNIITASRFVPIKGVDIIINSFDKFYKNLTDDEKLKVNLKILGSGPLEKDLKDLSKGLESESSISFIKWIKKNEMPHFYHSGDLFLFASHEGAGMVVAEAMSNELPVICFDNFGPGEISGNNSGLKVKYSNYNKSVDDFSKALEELFYNDDKRKRYAINAKRRFTRNFTWDTKGEKLRKIYESVS